MKYGQGLIAYTICGHYWTRKLIRQTAYRTIGESFYMADRYYNHLVRFESISVLHRYLRPPLDRHSETFRSDGKRPV